MSQYSLQWPESWLIALFIFVAQLLASAHVLRTKEDVRSAITWVGLIWLAPMLGLLAYFLFGINRIRRRARHVRKRRGLAPKADEMLDPGGPQLEDALPDAQNRWRTHSRLAGRVSGQSLTTGNTVTPLEGGRQAYDAMVKAIDDAERTIALTTYIFQADQVGRRFVSALARAHDRGVEVRVLVDAVGNLYGLKPVSNLLRRRGVPVTSFNPARLSWRLAFLNLRTHRKLLIVDGKIGFAGGMNIRKHHLEHTDGNPRVRDTHFRLAGPVVTQMTEAFADDWLFSSGESLNRGLWIPPVTAAATPAQARGIAARAVPDGPDEPHHRTSMILGSALASARKRVQIVTPYFLPEQALMDSLTQAALKGVEVQVMVPEKNNLPLFSLPAISGARPLVEMGCQFYLTKPPFDHTKLMIIDDAWVFFGSSNWDARSLRLNFEFNIECYDSRLAKTMTEWVSPRLVSATPVTIDDFRERPWGKRVAGRLLWLASPYL